jgi:hypothetical protein
MFHLAFTCRPRTFPEFSKPQAWYPCGKIGRGWSPPEDGWGRYTCPGWGIPNLAKTIDLLAGGHALLGWKKLCTYQLTCLTKNCWYLGWIHKSMYMEQSYASLGWGMFNQKTYFGPSLLVETSLLLLQTNWLLQEVTSFLAWLERVATT